MCVCVLPPGEIFGLQDPEHGGQLRRQVPHPTRGPRPDAQPVQQVRRRRFYDEFFLCFYRVSVPRGPVAT